MSKNVVAEMMLDSLREQLFKATQIFDAIRTARALLDSMAFVTEIGTENAESLHRILGHVEKELAKLHE